LNHNIYEATAFTPSDMFQNKDRYTQIYKAIESLHHQKTAGYFTVKLAIAAEVQQTTGEERRVHHDHREKTAEL